MIAWIKSLFTSVPKPPKMAEVGSCTVKIELVSGEKFERLFFGRAYDLGSFGVAVTTAEDAFNSWMNRNAELRMVAVGKDHYVPLQELKRVAATFGRYQAEVRADD